MHRRDWIEEEILKTDSLSEVILTVSGILLFLPLLVLLVVVLAR
jgi:hypothetical protein